MSWNLSARRAVPECIAVAVALVATLYVARRAPRAGFPLDDAWIHMTYGLALRQSGTLQYNSGFPATGASSPLWAVVAGAMHLLVGATGPSFAAAVALKAAGTACHAGTAAMSARLGRYCAVAPALRTTLALAAGCLVATAPALAFAGASGMEVSLTAFLMTGTLVAAANEKVMATGLLAGLASITRLEAIVLVGPALAVAHRGTSRPIAACPTIARAWIVAILPCAVWMARNYAIDGRLLPSTVYAKAGVPGSLPGQFYDTLHHALVDMLGQDGPMALPWAWVFAIASLPIGVYGVCRRAVRRLRSPSESAELMVGATGLSAALYVFGLCATTRFTIPWIFYFERYPLPALPLVIVAAAAAVAYAVDCLVPLRWKAIAGWILCSFLLLGCPQEVSELKARRRVFASDTATIQAVQVAMGRFIDRELPADAVVWSVDAGAIRYFGRRRTVDLLRLNSPELLAEGHVARDWWPDSIVIIPSYGFRVEGQDLDVRFQVRAPSPFDDGPTQSLLRCPDDRKATVEVWRAEALIARGGCARATLTAVDHKN